MGKLEGKVAVITGGSSGMAPGGGEVDKPIGLISETLVDDTIHLNARGSGTPFTLQKALPLMRDGGSIILSASNAHLNGFAEASVYAAAKAAVRSFARSLANDLKGRKIRVNGMSPGAIGDTAAFAGISKGLTDLYVSLVPLGRFGLSEEIASAALYLASDESRFTPAIEFVVDEGMAQV